MGILAYAFAFTYVSLTSCCNSSDKWSPLYGFQSSLLRILKRHIRSIFYRLNRLFAACSRKSEPSCTGLKIFSSLIDRMRTKAISRRTNRQTSKWEKCETFSDVWSACWVGKLVWPRLLSSTFKPWNLHRRRSSGKHDSHLLVGLSMFFSVLSDAGAVFLDSSLHLRFHTCECTHYQINFYKQPL